MSLPSNRFRRGLIAYSVLTILAMALLFQVGRLITLNRHISRDKPVYTGQYAVVPEKPQRGMIIDRCGRILAASSKAHAAFVEPRVLTDVKDTATQLQQLLDMPGHELCRMIYASRNPGYCRLKEEMTDNQSQLIKKSGIYGVGVESYWKRSYPAGELTSHVLGFVGTEGMGLSALELEYDKTLSGQDGRHFLFVDVARRPVGAKEAESVCRDGGGLILTIDSSIQRFAREALYKQWKAFHAESAVAVVMEPRSGEILALVSLPDFDPRDLSTVDDNVLKNRALTDPFEPGSIFKPIVTAIALDCGAIGYNDVIYCERGNYHGKGFGRIGEYNNHQFEDLSIKEILAESSNIGMAKIGQKLGKKRLHEGVTLFGFGSESGIDLPGEEPGLVHPVEKWTGYSVTRIPYGHEVMVTAIQILRAYAALANGGKLVTPRLLKARIHEDDHVETRPSYSGNIIKPEVANWLVREALVSVVNDGTGKQAALDHWQVFGKTGTANIARSDERGYDETNYMASFAGGAPADNPAVVVLVCIRKPDKSLRKGYSGGRVAAPVVGEILERTLIYLRVPPSPQK